MGIILIVKRGLLRTHYATNLMAVTPTASWPWVRHLLVSVFDQDDPDSVATQHDRIIDAPVRQAPQGRLQIFECRRSLGEDVIGQTHVADSSRHGNGPHKRAEY